MLVLFEDSRVLAPDAFLDQVVEIFDSQVVEKLRATGTSLEAERGGEGVRETAQDAGLFLPSIEGVRLTTGLG